MPTKIHLLDGVSGTLDVFKNLGGSGMVTESNVQETPGLLPEVQAVQPEPGEASRWSLSRQDLPSAQSSLKQKAPDL